MHRFQAFKTLLKDIKKNASLVHKLRQFLLFHFAYWWICITKGLCVASLWTTQLCFFGIMAPWLFLGLSPCPYLGSVAVYPLNGCFSAPWLYLSSSMLVMGWSCQTTFFIKFPGAGILVFWPSPRGSWRMGAVTLNCV